MYSSQDPDENRSNPATCASPTTLGKGGSSMTSNMTPLPANFEPGPHDVICGRGKKCYNHIGNEKFRQRVLTHLEEYSLAKSKLDKSGVLSKVVDEVRQQSPNGGFVKQDENGVWHEVGDFLAREKTSQSFRDALHERYKSSNLSKKKRRQEEQSKNASSAATMARSEYEISSRLERISTELLGTQGLQGIDAINRKNYEILTGKAYDIPPASSRPRYMDASRRFSDVSADFRSLMERPIGESTHHMHDPLFGTEINAANAMPSDYGREKITPSAQAYREQERAQAVARHADPEFIRSSHHFPSVPPEVKGFHHSYPEISYYKLLNDEFSIHQPTSMHHSLPNLPLSKHGIDDRKRPAKEIEPIPFEQINIPGRSSYKSTSSESFAKKIPTAAFSSAVEEISPSVSNVVPGRRISRDLMECLDKMTYHSIADDNPFEPIPLAPQQETAHAMMRRSSDISGNSNLFSQNPLDESERDEFAEG